MKKLLIGCPVCRKHFTGLDPLPAEVSCPYCHLSFKVPYLEAGLDFREEAFRKLRKLMETWS